MNNHEFGKGTTVSLSIQFDELLDFRAIHFGEYYAKIQNRFPTTEDKPRLEHVVESFPVRPRVTGLRFSPTKLGRVCYLDVSGEEIVQLQPDRFAFNWSRGEGAYPRYETNHPTLFTEFEGFCDFVDKSKLGPVKPNLCEITYINNIVPHPDESVSECFAAVFSGVSWEFSNEWLDPPELMTLNRVFMIDENRGRLYAEAFVSRDEERDFITFKLTARVLHREEDDLQENMQLAHRWVVGGFVCLTQTSAREGRWEQSP
jgi:uncharacterized protein (TIGR04255 family)